MRCGEGGGGLWRGGIWGEAAWTCGGGFGVRGDFDLEAYVQDGVEDGKSGVVVVVLVIISFIFYWILEHLLCLKF